MRNVSGYRARLRDRLSPPRRGVGSPALHASRAERNGSQRPVPPSGLSAWLAIKPPVAAWARGRRAGPSVWAHPTTKAVAQPPERPTGAFGTSRYPQAARRQAFERINTSLARSSPRRWTSSASALAALSVACPPGRRGRRARPELPQTRRREPRRNSARASEGPRAGTSSGRRPGGGRARARPASSRSRAQPQPRAQWSGCGCRARGEDARRRSPATARTHVRTTDGASFRAPAGLTTWGRHLRAGLPAAEARTHVDGRRAAV